MRVWLVKGWHHLHTDNGGTYADPPLTTAVVLAEDERQAQIFLYGPRYWIGRTTAEEIGPDCALPPGIALISGDISR